MKIALVVASKNFRDEEYFIPYQIFKEKGMDLSVFSDKKGTIIGVYGGEGEAEHVLKELDSKNFAAVIFVGGPGAMKFLDNEEGYEIARKAKKEGTLLAAICISPLILAKAEVLKGVEATVWSSPLDKSSVNILKEKGGVYRDEDVVQDGKIITANGPEASEIFSWRVVDSLMS